MKHLLQPHSNQYLIWIKLTLRLHVDKLYIFPLYDWQFLWRCQMRFISTILFGSCPHDADTIIFGLQSSILAAGSFEAKPPNTTEWCSSLEQASTSTQRFRYHWHINDYTIPF